MRQRLRGRSPFFFFQLAVDPSSLDEYSWVFPKASITFPAATLCVFYGFLFFFAPQEIDSDLPLREGTIPILEAGPISPDD